MRGLCTEVGWEEVHTDVGGAFAEVIGGKTRSFGRDRVGGVGEGSKWGDGAKEVGEGIADGMAETGRNGIAKALERERPGSFVHTVNPMTRRE